MTVKNLIKIALEFVGESEILSKFENSEDLTDTEQAKVDCLVRCFNTVNQEIASEHLPYLFKESLSNVSSITFGELSKTPVNVFSVTNRFGMPLKFKVFGSFIQFSGKAKTIVYSYLPEDVTIDDEVESFVPPRIIAFGVASEFLLVRGLSSDAEIWETRFKNGLFVLSRKRGEHRLAKRSWL